MSCYDKNRIEIILKSQIQEKIEALGKHAKQCDKCYELLAALKTRNHWKSKKQQKQI